MLFSLFPVEGMYVCSDHPFDVDLHNHLQQFVSCFEIPASDCVVACELSVFFIAFLIALAVCTVKEWRYKYSEILSNTFLTN
jgi:hypothetical protein